MVKFFTLTIWVSSFNLMYSKILLLLIPPPIINNFILILFFNKLIDLSNVPLLQSSSKTNALENILAAVGAAWALNSPKDIIVAGLQTFN